MGLWALILSSILYGIVCVDFVIKKDYPLALVFLCYTVANFGYIWMGDFNRGVQ